jgi:hypothetical protein
LRGGSGQFSAGEVEFARQEECRTEVKTRVRLGRAGVFAFFVGFIELRATMSPAIPCSGPGPPVMEGTGNLQLGKISLEVIARFRKPQSGSVGDWRAQICTLRLEY